MHRLRVQDLLESEERPSGKSAQEAENATKGSPTETKYFVIEFIHDTICPFCYIGMRNLIVAIETYKAKHPDAVFEVTCTPFLLAPAAESSFYHKHHYYSAYRRLPESRFAVWDELGAKAGIKFTWNGITGNSRNSHKLLRFALQATPTTQRSTELTVYGPSKQAVYPPSTLRAPGEPVSRAQPRGPDLQMRLLDAITQSYHERDADLSSDAFLLDTAVAVTGFPRAEMQAVLDGREWDETIDHLSDEVQTRVSVRSRMDCDGPVVVAVPTMVLNHRWVYGGFQSVEDIVEQFDLLGRGVVVSPRLEYTPSSLVFDAGIADRVELAAGMDGGNSGGGDGGG